MSAMSAMGATPGGFVCPECGAARPAAGRCEIDGAPLQPIGDDVLLGATIGAYRVARLLGVGGMGRVYKGVHPTIGSRVAIKVLSRECTDRRDLVERFFAEAKAVNVIRHESIVNVLDLATLPDGRPYIIMEYLDGAPLASIIEHAARSGAPLPVGGIARLAAEVLDALAAAHAKGIVHRDLKPDNIFVTPSGRPKVLDFGIAKLSDLGAGSATATGSLLGTPHYMAPEQAAGKPVDHRADLYAIGVILFEAVTGQRPFQAESLFDLLRKHVEAPPPPPRALRPDLPPEVEAVILTALAKAPEHRFGSAQAMSMALQHATANLGPDQWAPITPASAQRAAPGGWQPTPPAGWGGGSQPGPAPHGPAPGSWPGAQPGPAPHGPAPGSWPGAQPGPAPYGPAPGSWPGAGAAHPPTPPMLQLQPSRRSRKGLWLALGISAAVGGTVAAGVVLSGGGEGGDAGAASGDSGSARAGAGEAAGAGPDKPGAADSGGDSGGGDPLEEAAGKQLEAALKNLDAVDTSVLPPATRKQVEEMKQIAKLPPRQRLARLRELAREMQKDLAAGGVAGGGGAGGGLAEAMDTIDQAAGSGSGSAGGKAGASGGEAGDSGAEAGDSGAGAGGAPSAGPWVTAHDLSYPDYDPKHLDVAAFVRWAIDEAHRAAPDVVLFRIDVSGVGADGAANLELPTLASDHGSLDLRFFSPARARPDPSVPIGVPQRGKTCELRIEAEPDGVRIRPISGFDCKDDTPIPPPRCTAAALWKRALAKRAPRGAIASLGYRAWSGTARWYFDIGSGSDRVFSHVFDDDC